MGQLAPVHIGVRFHDPSLPTKDGSGVVRVLPSNWRSRRDPAVLRSHPNKAVDVTSSFAVSMINNSLSEKVMLQWARAKADAEARTLHH